MHSEEVLGALGGMKEVLYNPTWLFSETKAA
jgi:hypothetical protein